MILFLLFKKLLYDFPKGFKRFKKFYKDNKKKCLCKYFLKIEVGKLSR